MRRRGIEPHAVSLSLCGHIGSLLLLFQMCAAQPELSAHVDITVSPAARPLRGLGRSEVLGRLENRPGGAGEGVLGAHCIHELWMRGEFATHIEAALEKLWEKAARSIPEWLPMRYVDWLPVAYEVTAQFKAERKGRSNIYLVLLDYEDRREGPHGVYVGMSRLFAGPAFRSAQGRHPRRRECAQAGARGPHRSGAASAVHRPASGCAYRGRTGRSVTGCGASRAGWALIPLRAGHLEGAP